jgi:hypothetical protein
MHLSLQEFLVRIAVVPVILATLIGLVRFRVLAPELRYLVGLLGFVLPLDIIGLVLMLQQRNNLFIMPIYAVGEFALLALLYARVLHSATFSRLLPWLVAGFAGYVLLDILAGSALTKFRPGQQVVQSVLILGLVALYFRKVLHELRIELLQREPMFWVSAGLVIYSLGYLQIALFSNYLLQYSDWLNMSIWAVHSLLFMVLYGCYCRALWLRPPK